DPSWQALIGPVTQPRPNGQNGHGTNGTNGHAKTNGEPQNGMAVQNAPETVLDDSIAISRGTTRRMPSFSRPGAVTMSPLASAPSVWPLVHAYRTRGHFAANLDPLGLLETAK